jgi:hypothetical protein
MDNDYITAPLRYRLEWGNMYYGGTWLLHWLNSYDYLQKRQRHA